MNLRTFHSRSAPSAGHGAPPRSSAEQLRAGKRPRTLSETISPLKNRRFREFTRYHTDAAPAVVEKPTLEAHEVSLRNPTPHALLLQLQQGLHVALRRSWWGETPRFVLLFLAVLLALYFMTIDSVYSDLYLVFVPWVVPLTVLATILHRRYNRRYVITYNWVSVATGYISLQLSETQCGFDKIKSVEVKRTILQRILGVGDIEISTAMIDQPEMDMAGIYNPFYYASLLREAIEVHNPGVTPSSANDL